MVRSKKDLIEIILCSLIIPEILFIAQELGRIDIAKDVFGRLGLLIVLALLGFGLLTIRSKVQPVGLRIVLQILLFPALMLTIVGPIVVLASYFSNRSSSSDVAVSAGRTSAGTYSGGYAGGYTGSYSGGYSSYSTRDSGDSSGSSFEERLDERKRKEDFNSAQKSFNDASWRYSNYVSSGSVQNAATQEHFMHEAMGNMLKSKSSGGDKAAFESAQRSYNSASFQMASYKKQGLTENALTQQHHMNLAMADMLKNSSPTTNKAGFESAKKDYENASRRYSEYKKQGLEKDAAREQDYMNRAFAEMLKNK
jgi:hypothetical protein